MPKEPKNDASPVKSDDPSLATPPDAFLDELNAQLECIRLAREALPAGAFDKGMVLGMANLSRAKTSAEAEARAARKQLIKEATDLDHGLVMRHLRLLPPEQRQRVIDELLRLDDESSVLA